MEKATVGATKMASLDAFNWFFGIPRLSLLEY